MRRAALLLTLAFSAMAADSARETVTTYQVEGVLREIRDGGTKALIAHKPIPGFMDAMTMEFTVRDRGELAGLASGDMLTFRLSVTSSRGWIDRIRKTGTAPASTGPSESTAPVLRPGDPVPDCSLVDTTGKGLRMSDFKGKAIAVTFIFTRCPYPEFCPKLSANFSAAQQLLNSRPALRERCHLLSVSIDPEYDTPERLRVYAQAEGADPSIWSFATGASAEIEKFSSAAGISVARNGQGITHDLRTMIIDADGRVERVFSGSGWTAQELADELESAAASPERLNR